MEPEIAGFPDYAAASVLVVGDVMLDRYWFGETARISPEAPVPVVNVHHMEERPGGAGNVALNIAALGANVTLIAIAGEDEAGRTLTDQLASARVSHDIHMLSGVPTITKLRVISRHQQLLRMDFEEKFPAFSPSRLLDYYQRALPDTRIVILSDYDKGTLSCARELIRMAREAGIPVLADPKGHDFGLYRGTDVVTPNLREFEKIVGHCQREEDIAIRGQKLLADYDIDALLLTRGERGMTLIRRDSADVVHLPAHAREVFDVTGAGDTVIAVLGATLAAGKKLTEAMVIANLAAGLVVGKLGAATVSSPELAAAFHKTEGPHGGILNEEQLIQALGRARINGERIVFTNGCFDILHAGHVAYLQQARTLGDRLVVAINDDASVQRLKGAARPINSVEQRMAVLSGLGVVDWVTSFADDTPERLLQMLRPDVLVKGGDYGVNEVVGAHIVRAFGGDVRVLGNIPGLSTSSIIDRVMQQNEKNEKNAKNEKSERNEKD